MARRQVKENYLGWRGWVWAGRYQAERYLYLLHRITGLGLVLYLMLHLCVMTVFRIQGQDVYETIMRLFDNPVFKAGEYLIFAAFIYHALNGLRLILQELGFILGKPTPPVYPYKDSLRKKRPIVLAMIAVVLIFVLVVLFDFVNGGF